MATWEFDWNVGGINHYISSNYSPLEFTDQDHLCVPFGFRLVIADDETVVPTIETIDLAWIDVLFADGDQTFHAVIQSEDKQLQLTYSIKKFSYSW